MKKVTEAEIYDKLTQLFKEIFMRDDLELSPALTAKDVPGWDSFKQIEIIIATEEIFKIKLRIREIEALYNVGDLVKAILLKTD